MPSFFRNLLRSRDLLDAQLELVADMPRVLSFLLAAASRGAAKPAEVEKLARLVSEYGEGEQGPGPQRAAQLPVRVSAPAHHHHLAPADLPKEGGRFDLAIALGVLAASGQVDAAACLGLEFVGEPALTEELRPVRGILPSALSVRNAGRALVVPRDNAAEAALVDALRVFLAEHLLEVCAQPRSRRSLAGLALGNTASPRISASCSRLRRSCCPLGHLPAPPRPNPRNDRRTWQSPAPRSRSDWIANFAVLLASFSLLSVRSAFDTAPVFSRRVFAFGLHFQDWCSYQNLNGSSNAAALPLGKSGYPHQ